MTSTHPVKRPLEWPLALQVVFPKSKSGFLIEATFINWTIGEVYVGFTGGIMSPPHSPDWTKGGRLGLSCGIRLTEIGLGGIVGKVFATGGLVYHHEEWFYIGGRSGDWPAFHDEFQIVGGMRFQLKLNQNPMTPLIELAGSLNIALGKSDDRTHIVNQGLCTVSLLFPIFGLPVH